MKRILLLAVFAFLSILCFSQSIVYVDSAASGANNGTSWANAYRYLSTALKAADTDNTIDSIFIAKGTYYPTGNKSGTNRDSSFLILRSNISLFGGFDPANGINEISQRAFPKYGGSRSILSGNINNQNDSLDNSWHVMIIATYENDRGAIRLDGLTIRESNGTMSPGGYKYYAGVGAGRPYSYYGIGGGILITSANTSISILNSRMSNNVYQGVHSRAKLRMDNCSVISNFTEAGSPTSSSNIVISGSGIYCLQSLNISNSLISGNQIYYSSASRGAGMYVEGELTMNYCEITNNSILDIANCSPFIGKGGGAGIFASGPHCTIKNSIITGNTVTITKPCVWDGELRAYRYGGGGGIGLQTNADIVNTVIAFNSVSGVNNASDLPYHFGGGGICMMENFSLNLVNSVLYGNQANVGAAITVVTKGQNWPVNISNSIVLNNSTVFTPGLTPTTNYSLVQGNTSTANGNLDATSPGQVFENPATSDFRLATGSVCINAGDNNLYRSAPFGNLDLFANNRISGTRIDLGAAENGSSSVAVPSVLYVDGTVAVSGNGSSWATAFKNLSDALMYANDNSTVDSILVARGTYYATGAQTGTDRNKAFLVRYGGLKIFGGFANGGGSFADRVLPDVSGGSNNGTILSGDILTAADSTDNSYHLMVVTKIPAYADSIVIDGFSFNNGNANAPSGTNYVYNSQSVYQYAGGAVMLWDVLNDKLLFRNCNFNNNSAGGWAGAIFNQNSKADFQKSGFFNNISQTSEGGAVFNTGSTSVLNFNNCRFERNTAKAGTGGAFYNHSNASIYFQKPFFSNNAAALKGGAVFNDQGTWMEVSNGFFFQNKSNTLGPNGHGGAAVFVNNAIFTGTNCTFFGHSTGAGLHGSLAGTGGGSITLKNSIAAHNPGSGGVAVLLGTTYAQSYSLVQDQNYSTDQNLNYSSTPLTNLYVNVADPDGADNTWLTADDGLRPGAASPVREEGNNDFIAGISTDIAGSNRVMGCNVDMGAYEFENPKMILHVDALNGNDNNSGMDWSSAHKTLSKALSLANSLPCVDTILVARGTYYPTGSQITGQSSYPQREMTFQIARPGIKLYGGFQPGGAGGWAARQFPITGNGTILSGDISSTADSLYNSFHVMVIAGIPEGSDSIIVDGFGITEGNANLLVYKSWNGVNVYEAEGGGLALFQIPGTTGIRNCKIYRNNAASMGGGMICRNSNPSVINSTFTNNSAGTGGGGLLCANSGLRVTNCNFFSNHAPDDGTGGAVLSLSASPVFTNCNLVGNTAAYQGGAARFFNGPNPVFTNCIIWGNTAPAQPTFSAVDVTVTVNNSIIEGGYAGTGNLNVDPMFGNEQTGDWRLKECSPAINSGINTAVPEGITTDLAGNARLQLGKVDLGVYESAANTSTVALLLTNAGISNVQVSNGTTVYADNCNEILASVSGDNSPTSISGNTTAKLWIETIQPVNFVKRHYEITPENMASSATGRVTLFFTQAEFDDFNTVNTLKLPTGPSDLAGKARLLIEKRPGTSSDGTGLPETYTGTFRTIDPEESDIIWNATATRWEVSFDVSGFSGFFVKTISQSLPLQLLSFTGSRKEGISQLHWETADEYNVSHFEIERSNDGVNYSAIGSVAAQNGASQQYRFNDPVQFNGVMYYRLKMLDLDVRFVYSQVVRLHSNAGGGSISIFPNPANDRLWVEFENTSLTGSEAQLMDGGGRVLNRFIIVQQKQPLLVASLKSGIYFIRFANGVVMKFIKK